MADPESGISNSPGDRALTLGIPLFRLVGGVLFGFFLIGNFSSLLDLRLRDPVSEMRFSGQVTDRIPMALLSFALLFCHPRFLRKRFESKALRILANVPLVLAISYALLIPLTMFSAANYFRNATFGLEQQVEGQLKKVRAVRDATMNLPSDQQQIMVDRYNQANPKKQAVDLTGFLKTLDDETKAAEVRLEQDRRNAIGVEQKSLYGTQFVQSLKIFLGAAAFIILWKLIGWARPAGQATLGAELGFGRHRRG